MVISEKLQTAIIWVAVANFAIFLFCYQLVFAKVAMANNGR